MYHQRVLSGKSILWFFSFFFFWSHSTEVVARRFLHGSVDRGGMGIPDIGIPTRTFALKNVLRILDSTHPVSSLAKFWLGPLGRFVINTPNWNSTIKSEIPAQHYAVAIAHLRHIQGVDADIDILHTLTARISERLDLNHVRCDSRVYRKWSSVVPTWLPGTTQDLRWRTAWNVLPTCDRLSRWGISRVSTCVRCTVTETVLHVFRDCPVARMTWSTLSCHYGLPLPAPFGLQNISFPKFRLRVLLTTLTEKVLWQMRCDIFRNRRWCLVRLLVSKVHGLHPTFRSYVCSDGRESFYLAVGMAARCRNHERCSPYQTPLCVSLYQQQEYSSRLNRLFHHCVS